MRISKSNKIDVTASKADKSPKGNVFFDEDGIRVTAIGDGNNGTIGIVENTTDTDYDISDYTIDLTVPAHGTLKLNADDEGWDTIWYFRKLHAKPLTPKQIKDLWDKEPLFMIFEDGSDAMCQENDYTLDDVLGMAADVYRDNDPDILPDPWENNVTACGDIKGSKKLSANDQALSHIKAAIDILGKSGMKDDVTKDSIANLGVVMFDLKSKK